MMGQMRRMMSTWGGLFSISQLQHKTSTTSDLHHIEFRNKDREVSQVAFYLYKAQPGSSHVKASYSLEIFKKPETSNPINRTKKIEVRNYATAGWGYSKWAPVDNFVFILHAVNFCNLMKDGNFFFSHSFLGVI